ncbi:hypothetical protein TpMuguga_01g00915 [Theileria parva strain Muguga]|uniref:uncharacterized protein n=1 Tax=Theileria parva strain Muguga TaxID=333668 RepID=UPI001C61E3A2|nr:uncharacterized protein TpMuguga_01g00915 [Theileria parva strain Muguga]EAN34153.2 hypothetical protein TpMuguga_01g00915 [Theileria parva strain Muguga]
MNLVYINSFFIYYYIFVNEIKLVYSLYDYCINNNFLHLNDLSFHCDRESPDSYPYQEALMKCVEETDCVSVRVDEFDVYNESFGLSKLCYSSNLTDLYPLLNGRVSVKANRISGALSSLYNINLNRKGICKPSQIIGTLETVSSYSDAIRECKRLSCDFFTLKFLKPRTPNTEFDKNVIISNSAEFCIGDPIGVYSEGDLMAQKIPNKYI